MTNSGPGFGWRGAVYLALLLATLANAGCLAVAAAGAAGGAAAGYAYYKGRVNQTFTASFEDTWNAARLALADLHMTIQSEERETVTSGSIKTQTNDGDQVRIYLDADKSKIPADGAVTRVGVRVSTFGDSGVSDRVLAQIEAHLAPRSAGQPVPPGAPLQPVPAPPSAAGWSRTLPPPAPAGSFPPSTPPPPLLPTEPIRASGRQ